jgi:C-terminal processing protease CtpA/Prc
VIPGSPAAEAGVAVGDHLTDIANPHAAGLTLERIRELFRKDGQVYALELRRGDATMGLDLRTRRLL